MGNAVVLEMVMTFGLVYTVYATTVDPRSRRGRLGVMAPMVRGVSGGAGDPVGGPFDGGSLKRAAAGGPLVGGGLAGFMYELIFVSHSRQRFRRSYY